MLPNRVLFIFAVVVLLCHDVAAWGRRRRRCNSSPCQWHWSSCSVTCGGGTQYPIKTANQGSCGSCNMPSGTRPCNTQCCRLDCSWNSWGSWADCSVSCGGGTQVRVRAAYGPSCGGTPCSGPGQESRQCNAQCCPVDCKWTSWEPIGDCSATCGGGIQMRTRTYEEYASCNGEPCTGGTTDSIACNTYCCAVHCVWDSWGTWSTCDKSCGGGTQYHTRPIATPASCGGQECQGPDTEDQDCNTQCCVIDCAWGDWSTWGTCTKTCDTGEQGRERSIVQTSECGGAECTGKLCDTKPCSEFCCPNQCDFTPWSQWGECTKTCGTGSQTRGRTVTAHPSCSAGVCLGDLEEERNCSTQCCPVDCVMSQWTQWSECTATCGITGRQQRSRYVKQEMVCNGTECEPDLNQTQSCNQICFQDQSVLTSSGCVCADGWQGVCCEMDINECDFVNCTEHSYCVNSDGSYECVCQHNYTKEGDQCLHYDKCAAGRDDCDPNAECTMQNMYDYICKCMPGYTGDGYNCTDIDECLMNEEPDGGSGTVEYSGEQIITEWSPICHAEAECYNTDGSYYCQCNVGYEGSGWNCTDFDECEVHYAKYNTSNRAATGESDADYCDQFAECENFYGGYACSCMEGYYGDGYNCTEIDECASSPCMNGGYCIDEVANFSCFCTDGYEGELCLSDINECERVTSDCNIENGTCYNTVGSYVCECKPGYRGDGEVCVDIDECADGTYECEGEFPICRNVPGHYVCECEPGSVLENGALIPAGDSEVEAAG